MKLYNVEVFLPSLTFRSSCQTSNAPYSFDYLNIDKNKIELVSIEAYKGDYIRIQSPEFNVCGIITGVEPKKNMVVLTYESFLRILENNVYVDRSSLATTTLEAWMAQIIIGQYVNNADALQNINGLEVIVLSGTENALLDLDESVVDFYQDIVIPAFTNYGITITASIDAQVKHIVFMIQKNIAPEIVIESELPNIISKNIVIKEAKETLNKLVIINEANESEKAIYYRHTDNTISTNHEINRIEPVVYDTVFISVSGADAFADKAYEKAFSTLTAEEYDNLIELTVAPSDDMIKPYLLSIGQMASVIYKGNVYKTILTGIKYEADKVQLVFGAIRLELTTILRRRLK